jgi:hypothetical protein
MSPTIGSLVAALAKAQAKLQNPERNREVSVRMKTGGTYKFAYATLDAILAHARPILAAEEIALLGGIQQSDKGITISTMLAHSSGEWVESSVRFLAAVGTQETGGLITYGRRYTLCGLLGIAAEEDDDANAASGNTAEERPAAAKSEPKVEREPIPADIPAWEGKIARMNQKTGEKNGKPWTRYTLVGADGDEFTTFSDSAVELVKKNKDSFFQITYLQTKFGRDLQEIRIVADDEPPFGLD